MRKATLHPILLLASIAFLVGNIGATTDRDNLRCLSIRGSFAPDTQVDLPRNIIGVWEMVRPEGSIALSKAPLLRCLGRGAEFASVYSYSLTDTPVPRWNWAAYGRTFQVDGELYLVRQLLALSIECKTLSHVDYSAGQLSERNIPLASIQRSLEAAKLAYSTKNSSLVVEASDLVELLRGPDSSLLSVRPSIWVRPETVGVETCPAAVK